MRAVLVEATERLEHLREIAGQVGSACDDRGDDRSPTRAVCSAAECLRAPTPAAVKAAVSIHTFADWDNPAPGVFGADLVVHSGPPTHRRHTQTATFRDTLAARPNPHDF